MILPEMQVAILLDCCKDLADPTFRNPLEDYHMLFDVTELIRYRYLHIEHKSPSLTRLALTEKGMHFIQNSQ